MGTARESRPSELTFNSIANAVRGLDKLLWYGQQYHVDDIQEYADIIKTSLDVMLRQYKQEVKYEEKTDCCDGGCGCHGTPFVDPVFEKKDWYVTPIIPEPLKPKNG